MIMEENENENKNYNQYIELRFEGLEELNAQLQIVRDLQKQLLEAVHDAYDIRARVEAEMNQPFQAPSPISASEDSDEI